MPAPTVHYLDLDEIVAEVPKITIRLKNVEHALKLTSVRDWIIGMKAMQDAKAGDELENLEATVQQISRSFPTAAIEDLRDLTVGQLERLIDFVRGVNGTKTLEEGVKDAVTQVTPVGDAPVAGGDIGSENPPTAG